MKKLILGSATLLFALMAHHVSADVVEQYVVQQGDTLSGIAYAHGTTVEKLAENNGIVDVNLIYVGQELIIDETYEATPEIQQEQPQQEQQIQVKNDGSVEYAAQQMANATGLSYDTWYWIIMAESGGNPHVVNPASGTYGYFQIHPVHGMPSGASVDTQIQYAIKVYNAQGPGAWEVTH